MYINLHDIWDGGLHSFVACAVIIAIIAYGFYLNSKEHKKGGSGKSNSTTQSTTKEETKASDNK